MFLYFAANVSNLKAELDITKNKEFYLTFLPNFHNNWTNPTDRLRKGDSIYIFIYAALPTKGTIDFKDVYGNSYSENFDIPDPTKIYVFKKPAYDYALRGFNLSGNTNSSNHNEKITDFSYHIKADLPIQVYGHSQATLTSESFNVLPVESLGNDYFVLSYNSNVLNHTIGQRTPSQFAVVATEDDTEIEIIPSVPTHLNGLDTQRVTLNRGEVYLVQALTMGFDPDLSRSIVSSNKPIAVFSGQQRTKIPISLQGGRTSRDFICEQMPPLDSWSNEAVVVPFPEPSRYERVSYANDLLRVIAAYDNTELYVENILLTTLNRGEIYETDLTIPMHIMANAPIMAAGYKRSSGINETADSDFYRGDPLLQIIPTPNQYGESYRFITIQSYERPSGSSIATKIYDEHNIAVIALPENIPSLLLDGQPLNPTIFKTVMGSNYRYAHIRITEGTHIMTGDYPFGLFVCGYGNANSYGYFCGVVSKRDDYEPPELQSNVDCFESEGIVTDKKLKSISAPQNFRTNVDVQLEQFNPYVEEAKFSAKLLNNYLDGKYRIIAIDSVGQQTSKDIDIPGFTVRVISRLANDEPVEVPLILDSLAVSQQKCYDYTLFNYGKFEQKVSNIKLLKNSKYTSLSLPESIVLGPGKTLDFRICFESDENVYLIDTLSISSDCITRNVLALDIVASKDENAPLVSSDRDPCNKYFDFMISDSLRSDLGLDTIIIIESVNLDNKLEKRSPKIFRLSSKVINPYEDAYIKFRVTDLAGFSTEIEKVLPGYTISFDMVNSLADSSLYYDFGERMVGIRYCDSILIKNYGKYEIALENVRVNNNIWFSIPPSQLPLILLPGQELPLRICYWANKPDFEVISDTLNFDFNCINMKITVMGTPDTLMFDGDTKCDVPLLFELEDIPEGAFLSKVFPNPSEGNLNVEFAAPADSQVEIKVYDYIGNSLKSLIFENLSKGFYRVPVDLNSLNSGSYIIKIRINNEHFGESFILSK